jgi:protease I
MSTKNVLMIIAHRNFRDEELLHTKSELESAGIKVTVASTSLSIAVGMFGAKTTPNILISNVNVEDFDAILFVGGSGAETYFNDPIAHNIAKEAYQKNKVVGAICIAPGILANSGILNGKKATVWNGKYVSILRNGGAIYTGESVTVDGNIITANGPAVASKFGKTIVNVLSKL